MISGCRTADQYDFHSTKWELGSMKWSAVIHNQGTHIYILRGENP